MKVIFLEDVPPNARVGDLKEVKDGYGRNYLLPRGLAVLATKDALQRAQLLRAAAQERRLKDETDWRDVVESLSETPVPIMMRAGPTGRLYGSVTAAQIAEKLSEMLGLSVDRRGVSIQTPIRLLGTFTVPVRFSEGVVADVRIVVEAESDGGEAEPDASSVESEPEVAPSPDEEKPAESPQEEAVKGS